MDVFTKFNRGEILALADENVYEAVQTYRSYISYLRANGFEEELIKTRNEFLLKLGKFALNKDNSEKLRELIAAFQELLIAYPDDTGIRAGCAECFVKLKQYDIALEILQEAKRKDIEIIRKIAEIASKTTDVELGLENSRFLCEKEPDVANNFCIFAGCLHNAYLKTSKRKYLDEAIINMEKACEMLPCVKIYKRNLITLYTQAKQEDKLKKAWDEYLNYSVSPKDSYEFSAYLIRKGDFENGFRHYECRFDCEENLKQDLNLPVYNGTQDLSDKHLLIQREQGFGDIIMFSRYINQIKAKKITLTVPPSICTLVKRNFPNINVVSELITSDYDYSLPLCSLCYILKATKDNIPNKDKYFYADKEKAEKFKQKFFNEGGFKIGIAFKGNKKGAKERDLKIEDFVPITEIPNVKVYSLQYDEPDSAFRDTKIINIANQVLDFDDTAAMMENMDLIVTTDSVYLNLAGALGKKTFGLFNYLQEFRWFDLSGDDVIWYESVKPYQCKEENEWKPVMQKVAEDIKKLV